eukprot:336839_1
MSVFSNLCSHHTLSGPNDNIITKTSGPNSESDKNSSFGRDIIKSGNNDIIQYQIKINKMKSRIGIGIVSNLHDHNTNSKFWGKHSYWLSLDCAIFVEDGKGKGELGHKCAAGDTLTLIIDMKDHKLSAMKNNNEGDIKTLAAIPKDSNLTYRFAICLTHVNDSAEIKYINNDINYNIKRLSKQIQELQVEKKEKENEIDEITKTVESITEKIRKLREEIRKLKGGNDLVDNNMIEASETNEKTTNSMINELNSLKKEMNEMRKEINALKTNNQANDNIYNNNSETKEIFEFFGDELKLPQYIDAFIYAGFTDFVSFALVTSDDLKDMGIVKLGHRHRILTALSKRWRK